MELALQRIVGDFLPNIARLREQLEQRSHTHPLLSLFGTARLSEGQVVGRSGPAETDPDGALVHYLAESVNLGSFHLALLIDRVRQKFSVTSESIAGFLYASPVFAQQFRGLITQGLDAYLAGDQVKAISVLVPQIENALRRLLHLLGQPPNKNRRGDPTTMTEKTLSDILEKEQAIRDCCGEDILLYLLTFLADPRGQNLRNRLAHGLLTAPEFHRGFSDRVLHILLLLACICPRGESDGQQAGVPDFFQEETAEALRSQADWLARQVGVDDAFFARLVGTDEATFSNWRVQAADLPPGGEETLRRLWRTVLHLLSFLNFDPAKVRELFQQTMPAQPSDEASALAPPWGGSSLKAYLERTGPAAIEKIDGWVTGLRFGDLCAG